MLLNRENISNAAVMIQPSLISYSFNSLPAPALLDVSSIAADRILLLDSYFSVVVFHGMTIAQWRNLGYQNQPEHQVYPNNCHMSILLSCWCWYFYHIHCGSFSLVSPYDENQGFWLELYFIDMYLGYGVSFTFALFFLPNSFEICCRHLPNCCKLHVMMLKS